MTPKAQTQAVKPPLPHACFVAPALYHVLDDVRRPLVQLAEDCQQWQPGCDRPSHAEIRHAVAMALLELQVLHFRLDAIVTAQANFRPVV